MKIVVISLPSSLERRAKAIEKLSALDLEFEFLDAIDGRTDEHPYFKNYNETAFLANRRRKAAPGELGCYVSHLLAWEKCIDLNQPIVVLEDDFEFTDGFSEGLKFVGQIVDKVSFVRLEPLESKFFVRSYEGKNFSLVKQLKAGVCSTGYVITPQGAKTFLRMGTDICYPIDIYIKNTLIHKQVLHAIVPNIVYATHADSIIGFKAREIREKGYILKMKRFILKRKYELGNLIVNFVNAVKYK
ncbi:MAG: glycosyltransferase family 25 protein [Methyloglobulus sp.]|nr:glycosyltransferase family 25 protein [Methyloglobulus sp.]